MFRIDYVDMVHKPRVQHFKVRSQAEKRVKTLVEAGLMVVHTSWTLEKMPDDDKKRLVYNETIQDEAA